MKKIVIAAILTLLFGYNANAQMIGATNRQSGARTPGNRTNSGWQVSLNAAGAFYIRRNISFCAGLEIHFGHLSESGLYLGGIIGGGYGLIADSAKYVMGSNYSNSGESWTYGMFLPMRADIGWYFGQGKRVRPYVHAAPGLFFLLGDDPTMTAVGLQFGPGINYGIWGPLSLKAEVNLDFCSMTTGRNVGYSSHSYYGKYTSFGIGPNVKIGAVYNF